MTISTQWQAHITAWSDSGQTQAAFCLAHDLNLHTFKYWRKRLGAASRASREPAFRALGVTALPAPLVLTLAADLRIEGAAHEMAALLVQLKQAGFFHAEA